MSQPRGVRNHNPGNIEYNGTPWQGLADPPSDGRFCRFADPTWGIRAIARVLITYQDKHGINTVRGIINRWAPPVENDTGAYAAHVAGKVGVGPDDQISVHEYAVMRPLIEAIILHENGVQPYSAAQIDKGLVLAGVEPPAKPLSKSRTVKGGQVAAGGTALTAVSEAVTQAASNVEPLIPYLETMKWVFIALTVIGIGIAIYARLDDRNKGLR